MLRELIVMKDQQIEELKAAQPPSRQRTASQTDISALQKKLELTELELLKRKRENRSIALSRDPTDPVLRELRAVKRELFFALAVGIKLSFAQVGIAINCNVHQLYEEAQGLHYKKWNAWIREEYDKARIRPNVV